MEATHDSQDLLSRMDISWMTDSSRALDIFIVCFPRILMNSATRSTKSENSRYCLPRRSCRPMKLGPVISQCATLRLWCSTIIEAKIFSISIGNKDISMDEIYDIITLDRYLQGIEFRMILTDDPEVKEICSYELDALICSYPEITMRRTLCWRRFKTMGRYIRLQNGRYILRFQINTIRSPSWDRLMKDIGDSWDELKDIKFSWRYIPLWLSRCIGVHDLQKFDIKYDGEIVAYRCLFRTRY